MNNLNLKTETEGESVGFNSKNEDISSCRVDASPFECSEIHSSSSNNSVIIPKKSRNSFKSNGTISKTVSIPFENSKKSRDMNEFEDSLTEPYRFSRNTKSTNSSEIIPLISEPILPKTPRKKFKKQSEQKILQEYNIEENDKQITYREMNYLSHKEKQIFENKFTKPINKNQTEYFNILSQKNKKIIFATGPAGTGKTLFATEQGVRRFLLGTVEKLIFTRPSVSVDEDLGYLPGSLEEKMAPWIRPIYDILYQHISPKEVSAMIEEKTIEISPLGFMRGRTFKNAWIVADEMQNSTISQMKMLLTRLGQNSCLVITGDLQQYDKINSSNNLEQNGLDDFLNRFSLRNMSSLNISSVKFDIEDIQREEVVKEVLGYYSTE